MPGLKKKTSYGILVLTLSNLSLQLLGFAFRIMLTKLAGTEAIGLNSLVMQIYSVAVSVCISGMNVAVVTLAARVQHHGIGAVRKLASIACGVYLVLFLCIAIPVFAMRNGIANRLIGDSGVSNALILVLCCIFLTGIENMFKSIHIGTGKAPTTAVSELVEQSVRFLFVWLLLKGLTDGSDAARVTAIVSGMVLSEFFSIGTLLISYVKHYMQADNAPQKYEELTIGSYMCILLPATLTGIASTAFESVSTLVLPNRLLIAGYTREGALSAIGMLNGVIAPFVTMPMCYIMAGNNIRLPLLSKAVGEKDCVQIAGIVKEAILSSAAPALLINIPAIPLMQRLISVFFGIMPQQHIVTLLTVKTIIIYFQVTSVMILNAMMKQGRVLLFAVIGELMQLLLIYYLAANPFLHVLGYLISMIIGEGLRLVLNLIAITVSLSEYNKEGTSKNPSQGSEAKKAIIRQALPSRQAAR